ncbi:MAG: HAMP domain-containing histidine kinase [Oscillospiraceae bacterium]|nr:HAMP domain-containing histidine kinase [Oscillospiraceae bacterium]
MKHYDRLLVLVPLLMLVVMIVTDVLLLNKDKRSRQYLVDANRIEQVILQGEMPDAADYPAVTGIAVYDGSSGFYDRDNEYLLREVNGTLYRIDYVETEQKRSTLLFIVDGMLLGLLVIIMGVLLHIRQKILKQFANLKDLPMQLAKGNLTESLKEDKSRYFGKFIWGLDMLRGELEHSKTNELERVRKEKTLLLSLSHDIKTPLAAIKLYAKGLSRGLFDEEKTLDAYHNISDKADEIEARLGEMIHALNNDFMQFDVKLSDFYLSSIVTRISAYYADKLAVTGTELQIGEYRDCMLSGDPDRLEEVLQNIFENAIKYGDGKRISVSFADEEDCRLITVANTGCTLPEEELTHIFESFWRGSNTGSKQGSGLGLYICSRLMQEMGGDIFAETEDGEMKMTVVCKKCG